MKLFVFGSTGDLVKRKVLPALQTLFMKGIYDVEVYALGRKEFTREAYHDFVCSGGCEPDFLDVLHYKQIDFDSEEVSGLCLSMFDKDKVNYIYVSLPPHTLEKVLSSLLTIRKHGYEIRVLIEKPFGENLSEAKKLEKLIIEEKLEDFVYLNDHYLFKDGIFSIEKQDFKKMRIVSIERVGLEGRSYYDAVGAIKDMVQSHFLNIAFKLINNPEEEFSHINVKKFKKGQYNEYPIELGKASKTETFADILFSTKTKEFEFITGKAFDEKESYVEIDGKKIEFDGDDSYLSVFSNFFAGNKKVFPSMGHAILAWRIVSEIEANKPELLSYTKGTSWKSLA